LVTVQQNKLAFGIFNGNAYAVGIGVGGNHKVGVNFFCLFKGEG
jgi:hypothetical protein